MNTKPLAKEVMEALTEAPKGQDEDVYAVILTAKQLAALYELLNSVIESTE